LASQGACGIGLIGLIVGLGLKNSSPEGSFWGADTSSRSWWFCFHQSAWL
jgi:hypothetical protein